MPLDIWIRPRQGLVYATLIEGEGAKTGSPMEVRCTWYRSTEASLCKLPVSASRIDPFPMRKPPPTSAFVHGMVKNLVPAPLTLPGMDQCCSPSGAQGWSCIERWYNACCVGGGLCGCVCWWGGGVLCSPMMRGVSREETSVSETKEPKICSLESPRLRPW